MNLLLRQALIIDPSSPFHQQTADLLIEDGIIKAIEPQLAAGNTKLIDVSNLSVSPGWVDVFSLFPDPGFEHKESLETGARAAAAGGYTDVFLLPNTAPVVHNKSAVSYIIQRSKPLPVSLHPIAAVTKNTEGKELAEMYDMHGAGAIAFGDGHCSIQSSGLLLKALQYIKAIDKTIIQLPDDKAISAGGQMNEGIISTQLGLPAKPAIAEELMISRDIELARYTGSKIHFTAVSTGKSIELIKKAKEEGINISCSVTPYHLYFCDEDLQSYDTYLKVNPPLRTRQDRAALRQAVMNGIVDCIASHHLPHEKDSKIVEFEYAKYGMIGLQTAFGVVRSALPDLSSEQLIALFSTRPRQLFDLPPATIAINEKACLSLFQTNEQWIVNEKDNHSLSANTPFFNKELTGKPIGIIHKDGLFLNEQ